MKSCFSCGVLVLESEKTCPSCGAILKQEDKVKKEVAATQTIETPIIENKIPISKKIIISPNPITSHKNKHILLIIISIIPILNLLLLPIYIYYKKNDYELRLIAKKIFIVVLVLTLLIFAIVTQYNLKTVYLKTKDFMRVIIKSFLGK